MNLKLRRLALTGVLAASAFGLAGVPAAQASHSQVAMFEDIGAVTNTAATIPRLRVLGVSAIRLSMAWNSIAPSPNSTHKPHGFHAASPGSYSSRAWAPWDNAIKQLNAAGISVDLDVAGGAPLWATGSGNSKRARSWKPSDSQYQAFIQAVATRYSGHYHGLPAVRFWSIWNEPNYGPSLAPQGRPGNTSVEYSPYLYRGLLSAGYKGLRAAGHAHDTILFGETAARGYPNPLSPRVSFGEFNEMKPIDFLRNLYCVGSNYRPLHGSAAAERGCPTTSSASRRFRSANPALFSLSGFADHPYSQWHQPNQEPHNDHDYASLADIGTLERSLDRAQRVYGSHKQFPIWNTEYGYLTSPPKHSTHSAPVLSPDTAAAYLNQAEYISWRNPRIASFDQYLLADAQIPTRGNGYGGFASGLLDFRGHQKATYEAWRLPLYMPSTRTHSGGDLEVWGAARPVFSERYDGLRGPESVQIQLEPSGSGTFTTVKTVSVTDPHGYFDTKVPFTHSGTVRLVYAYPSSTDSVLAPGYVTYSRHVSVRVS